MPSRPPSGASLRSGIDLIEIARLEGIRPEIRERFLRRVFTIQELEDARDSNLHLAGRFAAKEAVAKALGCGIGPVSWQEIEIRRGTGRRTGVGAVRKSQANCR